ncbi:hypothetical protein DJ42_5583 (plasmid) [Bacillus anthracis]|nr:hypothetical protein BAA_B0036 [Bacillus anthracis str. A0248]KFJ83974.1 hypothetical protein DJ42_5583 [Bacillus anthracis]
MVQNEKIIFVVTSIALVAGIMFATASNKDQSNNIVKKDSEKLVAKMVGPGGGMG